MIFNAKALDIDVRQTLQRIKIQATANYVPYSGANANLNLGLFGLTAASITLGVYTLTSTEFAFLDGQNQSVATTSDVEFNSIAVTSTSLVSNLNSEFWNGYSLPALETGKFLTNDGNVLSWGSAGIEWVTAPQYSNSSGVAGQVAYDENYFYVCYASNLWARYVKDATPWVSTASFFKKVDGDFILKTDGDKIELNE